MPKPADQSPGLIPLDDIAGRIRAVTRDDVVNRLTGWGHEALATAITIVVIVIIAIIVLRLLRSLVERVIQRVMERQDQTPRELKQKAQTLGNVIESTGRLLVFLIAGMMVLSNLGMNIAPLIASAGIAGLAIGFGAQSLIRDTLHGFFILFENQYGVGDVIRVNSFSGTVEEISLRRTVLRSINGAVVIVPNGEVRTVENLSKGWSRAVIDIETSATEDDTKVVEVLKDVLEGLQEDPEFGQYILEPPQFVGINAISVTGVTFRVMIKTEPLQQWAIERALRLRIRRAFREHGIAVPVLTSVSLPPSGA
ncbi:MAG TPA: mechanosensitive ion channel family protein [Thermomicrobiales bacterium]|nr:mechanosensitive ion channel family protein [Thermomicrobiales bacterium]